MKSFLTDNPVKRIEISLLFIFIPDNNKFIPRIQQFMDIFNIGINKSINIEMLNLNMEKPYEKEKYNEKHRCQILITNIYSALFFTAKLYRKTN